MITAPAHIKKLIHLLGVSCVFIRAASRDVTRTQAVHYRRKLLTQIKRT